MEHAFGTRLFAAANGRRRTKAKAAAAHSGYARDYLTLCVKLCHRLVLVLVRYGEVPQKRMQATARRCS